MLLVIKRCVCFAAPFSDVYRAQSIVPKWHTVDFGIDLLLLFFHTQTGIHADSAQVNPFFAHSRDKKLDTYASLCLTIGDARPSSYHYGFRLCSRWRCSVLGGQLGELG